MRRRLLVAGSSLVALLALVPGASAARTLTPQVDASQQVTQDPNPVRVYATPSVAIDPENKDILAVSDGEGRSANCKVQISTNAGMSWTQTADFTPPGYPVCVYGNLGSFADVTFGPDGTLFVALSGQKAGDWRQKIFLARSDDLGAHWQTVELPKQEPDFEHHDAGQSAASSVVVDPKHPERVYVGWWTNFNLGLSAVPADVEDNNLIRFPGRPKVAVSNDGGKSFADPVDTAGDLNAWLTEPHMTVGRNGELFVYYGDLVVDDNLPPDHNPDGHLWFTSSTDAGKSFAPPKALYERTRTKASNWAWLQAATGGVDPSNGDLYVAFEAVGAPVPVGQGKPAPTITTPPTTAAGQPFAPVSSLPGGGGATTTTAPPVKVEPPASDPAAVLKFMRSSDNGKTWSEPVKVNDVEPASHWGCCTFEPRMSVAPNGRIDVAWYDHRNDPAYDPTQTRVGNQNRFQDVYYSYSTDGGRSWAPNVKVTDRLIDRKLGVHSGNYGLKGPIGLASSDLGAFIAWDDTRNSVGDTQAQDIYFSRVRFPTQEAVFATSAPSHENKLLWSLLGAAIALTIAGVLLLAALRLRGKQVT
jgi:hypothetical protein